MKPHHGWMHGMLVGLMIVGFASSGLAATDTITLGSELFFTNAQAEKVQLPPGTYQVRQATDDAQDVLLLESSLGEFQIQGELMEHEGELVTSMAMSMPQSENEYVVMLLLPNGTGVEAWGSQNPVQTRGRVLRRTRPTATRKALQTLRPLARKKVSRSTPQRNPNRPDGILKSVKKPSEDLQQLQRKTRKISTSTSPTVGELVKTFTQLPGGKERLEQAKAQGVNISAKLSNRMPLKGLDYLTFRKVNVRKDRSIVLEGHGKEHRASNSRAYYWVTAPSTGWYLVNFQVRTSKKFRAELRHIGPGWFFQSLFSIPPLQAWGNPRTDQEVTYSYPAVVKLEKGFHELRIYAIQGSARVLDASIQAL